MLFFERSECKGTSIFTNLQINPKENSRINIRLIFKVDTCQFWIYYTLFIYYIGRRYITHRSEGEL